MSAPKTELLIMIDRTARSLSLAAGSYTIVRAPECDIVLDEESVSRLQARLVVGENGILMLEPLSDTSAVLLDGTPIER